MSISLKWAKMQQKFTHFEMIENQLFQIGQRLISSPFHFITMPKSGIVSGSRITDSQVFAPAQFKNQPNDYLLTLVLGLQ